VVQDYMMTMETKVSLMVEEARAMRQIIGPDEVIINLRPATKLVAISVQWMVIAQYFE
jgi:hypothetical protein